MTTTAKVAIAILAALLIGAVGYAGFVSYQYTTTRKELNRLEDELERTYIAAEEVQFKAVAAHRAQIAERDQQIADLRKRDSLLTARLKQNRTYAHETRTRIAAMDTTELLLELQRVLTIRGQAQ